MTNRSTLLKRPERRQALIDAATRAFARDGYAATSLHHVAAEAQVSRVLIYRHFDTKADLYRAALDAVAHQLMEATGGPGHLGPESLAGLVGVARQNPDGFRLFFAHAAREPDFRDHADWLGTSMAETALPYIAEAVPDEARRRWAAAMVPAVVIDGLLAWLDAGAPDPDAVPTLLGDVVGGIIAAMAKEA